MSGHHYYYSPNNSHLRGRHSAVLFHMQGRRWRLEQQRNKIVAIGIPPAPKSAGRLQPTIVKTQRKVWGTVFTFFFSERRRSNNRVVIALTNPLRELVNSLAPSK